MIDIAQRLDEWVASPAATKADIRGMKTAMRIAASRIRELEQERDHYALAAKAEAKFVEELRNEVCELEQDAARYRWLREEAGRDYVEFREEPYEHELDLDAAIDAARGESNAG